MQTIQNAIDGHKVTSASLRIAPVYNPATGEQTADLPLSTVEDVDFRRCGRQEGGRRLGHDAAPEAHQAHVPLQGASGS